MEDLQTAYSEEREINLENSESNDLIIRNDDYDPWKHGTITIMAPNNDGKVKIYPSGKVEGTIPFDEASQIFWDSVCENFAKTAQLQWMHDVVSGMAAALDREEDDLETRVKTAKEMATLALDRLQKKHPEAG